MSKKSFKISTNDLAISPHGLVIVTEQLREAVKSIGIGNIPILAGKHNSGCTNDDCGGNNGDTNFECKNNKCG